MTSSSEPEQESEPTSDTEPTPESESESAPKHRRPQRETVEQTYGIGGEAPHPGRGPVIALHALGSGIDVAFDPEHRRNKWAMPGDRYRMHGHQVMAIDDLTRQLIPILGAHFGISATHSIDSVVMAMLERRRYFLALHADRIEDVDGVTRAIHAHSNRRDFPLTHVTAAPEDEAAIDALCTRANCGTVVLDLTTPFPLSNNFLLKLVSEHYHLWTIIVAPSRDVLKACVEDELTAIMLPHAGFDRAHRFETLRGATFTPPRKP